MLLLVTALSEPSVVLSTTVPALEVRLLPFASFNCTVIVDLELPLAIILGGEAVITVLVTETGPEIKFTVALFANSFPASVPLTVAVPIVVAAVNVAVYLPLLLSVTTPKVPSELFSIRVPPLVVRVLPLWSLS